jgi:transcriptional regulator with XRE-family HTH domain
MDCLKWRCIVMGDVSYALLEELMTKDEKVFYRDLGKRVAQLRKQNHLTQVQTAHDLGVSQQQIASYEAGRVKIPVFSLPRLASILAAPIDEIVGLQKPTHRGPASKLQQQLQRIGLLPRAKQKFIIDMLDALIRQDLTDSTQGLLRKGGPGP